MSFSQIDLSLANFSPVTWEENGIVGKRSILPGGVRVISEHIPGQRSTSISCWIGAGSRDESRDAQGSTHFLEHMLFKGTKKRSTQDISELSDYLGGAMNAATSRQYTCYYGRVFEADTDELLDLLIDMLTSSTLDAKQMEVERGVILEELAASDDDVNEVAQNAILPLVLGDHSLALPVGGTIETVQALEHSHMLEHYQQNYNSRELVVSIAGQVNHDEMCNKLLALLSVYGWSTTQGITPAPRRRKADISYIGGEEKFIPHSSRQSAVVIGMPGINLGHVDETALTMLDIVLGGGVSSRLFQEVREKRGLAYSTFSWHSNWNEGGIFALEAACSPENTAQVKQVMLDCLQAVANDGISQRELDIAFKQRQAQLIFSAETNGFRKNRLGYAEIFRGELNSISYVLEQARAVTIADVQRVAENLLSVPPAVVISGGGK